MKSLSLWIGGVLLVANIAILMLLTDCADIVTIMTSCASASTSLLIFTCSMLHIKDGFKVSLPFLFIFKRFFVNYTYYCIFVCPEISDNQYKY